MSLTVGIDAGGTKTTAIIINREREILFKTCRGEGNVAVDFRTSSSSIVEALRDCLSSQYGKQCSRIVAGVAGIEVQPYEMLLREKIVEVTDLPVILINDALLAYYSVFNNREGILTIAGTGSISIGMKDEDFYYAGGWGHLIGDKGSSYDIAIEACKKIANEWDVGSPMSEFTKKLVEHLAIVNKQDLKQFIYNSSKGEIALLATYIYRLAKEGDEVSRLLFYQAGNDLALETLKLITKMKIESYEKLSIVGRGSLLEKNEYVYCAFKRKIASVFSNVDIQISGVPAALGAITIAEKNLCKNLTG